MFKHIFVPTDGSELSRATAQRAVSFAKEAGARITAFFSKPEYPIAYFGEGALIDPTTPEKFAELADQQANEYLGEVAKLCADAGVECSTVSATSDVPYEAIIEAAEQCRLRPDLHGLARPPRRRRAAARQRNAESAGALDDSGAGAPLARSGARDALTAPAGGSPPIASSLAWPQRAGPRQWRLTKSAARCGRPNR